MNDELTNRLEASLTPERKALIAEAEKINIEIYKAKQKTEPTLGELIEEAIREWMKMREKTSEKP
ncbi:MAG: hypothetical protein WC325_10250 [Candidatus Bathyarchaeia archaeon]|jgi:lipid II:glycine glycyltransferase (peptidoglycan interpeptide bridge formation enzyme)